MSASDFLKELISLFAYKSYSYDKNCILPEQFHYLKYFLFFEVVEIPPDDKIILLHYEEKKTKILFCK